MAAMVKGRKTGTKDSHYTTLVLPPCKICSGEATGYHFGVITCEACKAFYRRALVQKRTPKCKKYGNCRILPNQSKNCSACRLNLCKEAGMSVNAVRRGRFTLALRTQAIVEANALEGKMSTSAGDENELRDRVYTEERSGQSSESFTFSGQGPFNGHLNQLTPLGQGHFDHQPDLEADFLHVIASAIDTTPLIHVSADLMMSSDDSLSSDSGSNTSTDVSVGREPPTFNMVGLGSPMDVTVYRAEEPTLDVKAGLVKACELEYLISNLVAGQELVYPSLKKHFSQPLEEVHTTIFEEFTLKHEIFHGVFGESKSLTTEEHQQVFAQTGEDPDDRLTQIQLYAQGMEESIEQYSMFVNLIPGFELLSLNDTSTLMKAAHLEVWFLGNFMLFNKRLGVALRWDGSQSGTKEHMTKFFPPDWIDMNFVFANSLNKLKLTFEEIAVIRAIVLTAADRCTVQDKGKVQAMQERFLEALRFHISKTTNAPHARLARIFDRLMTVRSMNRINVGVNQCFLHDWGFLMAGFPRWKEMLAYQDY